MREALAKLYAAGGARRFYSGLGPALVQAPLSRFGDTASNAGALALLGSFDSTRDLPVAAKTVLASVTAGAFRMLLVPVDTVKTIMQVEGKGGLPALSAKLKANGAQALFHGALASAGATAAGHWPWFAVYNMLQEKVPTPSGKLERLGRNAGIGFASSVVSDTLTNSLRVVKTYRQTSAVRISYAQSVRDVVAKDGWGGLMGRGLKTRLLANGLQGLLFSVLWRAMEDAWNKASEGRGSRAKEG